MSKKRKKETFGSLACGYGWVGERPADLSKQFRKLCNRFSRLRRKYKIDALAFSGSSGCAGAFVIAAKYNIPLIYVRKPGERSHGTKIECNAEYGVVIENYLIIDDFVSTGETVNRIVKSINSYTRKHSIAKATSLGVLCYDEYHDKDREVQTELGDYTIFSCN